MSKLLSKIKKTFYVYCEYLKRINNPFYFFLYLLFITLSYGFYIFNRTVSIDDFARDLYYGYGNLKLSGLRWGQYLINMFFSFIKISPLTEKLLGIVLLVISSTILGCLFYEINCQKNRMLPYVISSIIFATFPLFNEILEYTEACIPLGFGYCIIAMSILYQSINICEVSDYIVLGALMSLVASSAESLLFAYITIVLMITYIIRNNNKSFNWFKHSIKYSIPLIISIILRFVVGYSIISFAGLEYKMNGASSINWVGGDITNCFKEIIYNAWYYFARSFAYFPILLFVASIFIFVLIIIIKSKKDKNLLIIGFLIILSIFSLSIVQGIKLGYRNARGVELLVSFVVFILSNDIKTKKIEVLYSLITIVLCFRQSSYINKLFSLNNLRSENETSIVRNIGYKLYSEYDLSKQVVFCGQYNLGKFIESQICINENEISGKVESWLRAKTGHLEKRYYDEYVLDNMDSNINWCTGAFGSFGGQIMMQEYLSYCGYDIELIDKKNIDELLPKFEERAKQYLMKPLEIKEFDDYIIVYLGPTLENDYVGN